MSSLTVEEDQKWLPTSVQVTVLRGRGLRGKGKHGTSDVYTIIQLGKEKYSTGVAEKTTEPEWREECSFELQPGVLESGCPAGSNELVLTVMHRALIGMDVFLGQAVIRLDEVFHQTRSLKNEWYRLNSKTGKKEKERGELQLSVQFTRNNLTASMYDLVMKDKSASTFSKLKEHMKGKRRSSDKDSSSAVLPSGYGSLYRMRQRLPSDGGGEEDYEDDEGGEARRSKMRTFFLRGKLRKSSDTRSSTSLGSESSESSSRGGSLSPTAGISVVVSDLSNSPSNSSNLTADNSPEHTANTSPKSSSLKCEFGDEDVGEITIAVPQPTVCVNGSHAYTVQPLDPGSGTPAGSSGLGLLHKSLPLSMSLQNLTPRAPPDVLGGPAGDGRRWSFDKPGEEEKAAIAAALEKSGPMLSEEEEQEERLRQAAPSKAASAPAPESEVQGRKQKRNLFSLGRSEPTGKSPSQQEAAEEKHKGWFASKDLHSKPSTDPHPPPLPPNHPNNPPVDAPSVVSSLHHTNPFCQSQTSPPPLSRCNPFFSLLQHNPFYGDSAQTTEQPRPSLPPLPYLSSARPPIAQLFPQASDPRSVPTLRNQPATDVHSDTTRDVAAIARRRPLPPPPLPTEKTPLHRKSSNPFTSAGGLGGDPEWDESFEAFAARRLQSPEDRAAESRTQHIASRDRPAERRSHQGADADELRHHTFPFSKVAEQAASFPALHFDALPLALETIPEHRSFESDDATFPNPNAAFIETNRLSGTTNDLTHTNVQQAPCQTFSVHLNSSSPDASSSGIGSSADEDFLSCFSSQSDKFSASSSEETENNVPSSEKQTVVNSGSGSQDETSDESTDPSLDDAAHQTVIRHENSDTERVDLSGCEGSFAPHSLVNSHPQPVFTTETRTEGVDTQTLHISDVLVPDLFPNSFGSLKFEEDKDIADVSCGDLIIDLNNSAAELSSSPSSFYVASSSPVQQRFLDPSCEGAGEPDFGDSFDIGHISSPADLKHSDISNQSSSSFLQNLNVSCDSQDYQTCESRPPSKSSEASEPNETLRSAVSTLCADSANNTTSPASVSGLEAPAKWFQSDRFEGSLSRSETLEAIEAPPAGLTDSCESRRPKRLSEGAEEDQHGLTSNDDPPGGAALHRSQSEGTLAPAFPSLQASFGSDPGAIQLCSLAPLSFPPLPSFAPPLTSVSRTSPVALSAFPPLANASPAGAAQVSTPTSPETERQRRQGLEQHDSPHPVKPLTTAMLTEEKRSVLATGLEKLKSTIHPGRSSSSGGGGGGAGSQPTETEADKKKPLTEGAGSYYHLTHSELVALLVQREAELRRQKAEFERQKLLLAKREVELRRLKPQVRDLEDYIDTLLVRIMEQKPTLLQVRTKLK